jgi:hypothetical protein
MTSRKYGRRRAYPQFNYQRAGGLTRFERIAMALARFTKACGVK